MLIIIISLSLLASICSFKYQNINQRRHLVLYSNTNEEYTNNIAKFLSSFLPNAKTNNNFNSNGNLLDNINWNETKRKKTSISTLSKDLEKELYKREWFVTGNVVPSFFDDQFSFQDPDVKLKGIENYARGVNKLFTQGVTRGEIISVNVNNTIANTITCTWRLEGRVNIGPGLPIKGYIVYTNLLVNDKGLIIFQEDKFSIPGYDIILSAFFPWLPFLSPAAPPASLLR